MAQSEGVTAGQIAGYSYGKPDVSSSPITDEQFEEMKKGARFDERDVAYLRKAGEVLREYVSEIVHLWRDHIISTIPHLAQHSRSPEGKPIPEYLAKSNLRFEQWILDTCLRPYDRTWLDYQNEIGLRHTALKKNQTDGVASTPHIPLRHILPFVAVMNATLKPYLAKQGDTNEDVEGMYLAWSKSMQMQIAIWTESYKEAAVTAISDGSERSAAG